MSTDWSIRPVQPDDLAALQDVADLHVDLLHFGPMAALGPTFIREICYRKEMEEGVLYLGECRVVDDLAGFIAYTDQPFEFHKSIMKKHWLHAGWLTFLAILMKPSRLLAMGRVAKAIFARIGESHTDDPGMGEIVCIAVRPDYLKASVVKSLGTRIPEELLQYAATDLARTYGVQKLRMIVDADNKHALFLYHRLGARFERLTWAGEPKTDVYFDLAHQLIARE